MPADTTVKQAAVQPQYESLTPVVGWFVVEPSGTPLLGLMGKSKLKAIERCIGFPNDKCRQWLDLEALGWRCKQLVINATDITV